MNDLASRGAGGLGEPAQDRRSFIRTRHSPLAPAPTPTPHTTESYRVTIIHYHQSITSVRKIDFIRTAQWPRTEQSSVGWFAVTVLPRLPLSYAAMASAIASASAAAMASAAASAIASASAAAMASA